MLRLMCSRQRDRLISQMPGATGSVARTSGATAQHFALAAGCTPLLRWMA